MFLFEVVCELCRFLSCPLPSLCQLGDGKRNRTAPVHDLDAAIVGVPRIAFCYEDQINPGLPPCVRFFRPHGGVLELPIVFDVRSITMTSQISLTVLSHIF